MNAHEIMLSSMKRQVPRIKHTFEGESSDGHAQVAPPSLPPPPLILRNSQVVLNPPEIQRSCCFPCQPGASNISEITIHLRHVENVSKIHLHLKHSKTKCELWSTVWSTSRVLSEMMASEPVKVLLSGAHVIEVGAGTALCGLTAALQGAFVTVTDSSDMSLDLVSESAALNEVSSHVKTLRLDWHSDSNLAPKHELLIGSDVLFLRTNVESIVGVIQNCVLPGGMAVIICPGRPSSLEFESCVEAREGMSVEAFEAHDLRVSYSSTLKLARLYFVSVGHQLTRWAFALKSALQEAWDLIGIRPILCGDAKYQYTVNLT